MKKIVSMFVIGLVMVSFLGLKCDPEENPPDEGDFMIEMVTDTTLTVASGGTAEFEFDLRNYTPDDIVLTVDVPEANNNLPQDWQWQICVGEMCLMPGAPATDTVEANGTSDIHFSIITTTEGTEGNVIVEVSGSTDEVDQKTLIVNISQ